MHSDFRVDLSIQRGHVGEGAITFPVERAHDLNARIRHIVTAEGLPIDCRRALSLARSSEAKRQAGEDLDAALELMETWYGTPAICRSLILQLPRDLPLPNAPSPVGPGQTGQVSPAALSQTREHEIERRPRPRRQIRPQLLERRPSAGIFICLPAGSCANGDGTPWPPWVRLPAAEANELSPAPVVHETLCENAACRIARAEETARLKGRSVHVRLPVVTVAGS